MCGAHDAHKGGRKLNPGLVGLEVEVRTTQSPLLCPRGFPLMFKDGVRFGPILVVVLTRRKLCFRTGLAVGLEVNHSILTGILNISTIL